MRLAAAVGFADTMSHMERKAVELALQNVAVVHLGSAGTPGELELVEIEGVEASFGIVEHAVVAVESNAGIVGSVEIAESFAMILGSAVTGSDGHEVRVELLACIGMLEGIGPKIPHWVCCQSDRRKSARFSVFAS